MRRFAYWTRYNIFQDTTLRKWKLITVFLYKVKVVLYTFVRKGVPVREDTFPEPLACEVGWPVAFLATLTHLLLGEAFSEGIKSGLTCRLFTWEACALTTMLPHPSCIRRILNSMIQY